MLHTTYMATALGSTQLSDSVVVCEGSFITEQQRYNFFQRNNVQPSNILKGSSTLYDSIDFPFSDVENVLSSDERLNFLYILVNCPLTHNFRVYDEYVFKNFPNTTRLLKQMRHGGDTFVFKKRNNDVLFVKFHNIYEGPKLLYIKI